MKKLIILISSLALLSLTSCNKSETLESKNNNSATTIIEKDDKTIKEDKIIEDITLANNTNTEKIESLEKEESIKDKTPIVNEAPEEDTVTIVDDSPAKDTSIVDKSSVEKEAPIKDSVPIKNNEVSSENIIKEDLETENLIIPVSEEDAINHKTDNTIYFFVSNSNADGFHIIEKNVATSDLKAVLDLAVSNYSVPTVPKGTVVNSAYVENGTAYINLNNFFATDSQSGASASTYLKIYSIVNLAIYNKVFGVDKVVLSIEGGSDFIGQTFIPEFYTAKLFNKGSY